MPLAMATLTILLVIILFFLLQRCCFSGALMAVVEG